jgi:hypothetical protein
MRIVRQLKQVMEPFRVLFKELKERNKHLPSHCFCKENKNPQKCYNIVLVVGGGVDLLFANSHFLLVGSFYLPPKKSEG